MSNLRSQRTVTVNPGQSAIAKYELDNTAVYGNYIGDGTVLSPSSRLGRGASRRVVAPADRAQAAHIESPWDMFSNCGGGKCLTLTLNDDETGDSREDLDFRDYNATRAVGLPLSPASAHSARFTASSSRQ